jgi:hypothetical protein
MSFYNLTTNSAFQLVSILCDRQIGSGMSRTVYDSRVLEDYVIKFEETSGCFQNQLEWEIWHNVKYTKFAKWFAPCEWISDNGSVLIMKKTTPASKYPDKMPAFLTDFKKTNYGIYKNHLVCHDYGTSLCVTTGLTKRMRKATWSEN